MEIQKEYNLRYLLAKSVLHEEKRRTSSDSGEQTQENRARRLPTSEQN
jgi:hypothetical protein